MKEFAKKYLEVVNGASSISQGWIRNIDDPASHDVDNNLLFVSGLRTVRDVDENQNRSYFENYFINQNKKHLQLTHSNLLSTQPKCVLYDISRSGNMTISFYNQGIGTAGVKKENGSFIEIHDKNKGLFRIETSSAHGKIIGDTWFGGCNWSSDERYVIYVAQLANNNRKTVIEDLATPPPPPSSSSSTVATSENAEETSSTSSCPPVFKNKFDYQEDWGERYVDVSELGLFVFDIVHRKIIPLSLNSVADYTIGQPIFIQQQSTAAEKSQRYFIAYTAWNTKPRKLGMIYCYNRKSSIWMADITDLLLQSLPVTEGKQPSPVQPQTISFWKVSNDIEISRSPRSSPSGQSLVFLGNKKGFLTHGGCAELFLVDLSPLFSSSTAAGDAVQAISKGEKSLQVKTVVSEVRKPQMKIDNGNHHCLGFPGLYLDQLPRQCFLNENNIICSSLWESREALLHISLEDKKGDAKDIKEPFEHIHDLRWFADLLLTHPSNTTTTEEVNHHEHFAKSSFQVLDISLPHGIVLGQISNPVHPFQLIVLKIHHDLTHEVIAMSHGCHDGGCNSNHNIGKSYAISSKFLFPLENPLSATVTTTAATTEVKWKVFHHETNGIPFNSILLYPVVSSSGGGMGEGKKTPSSLPLIVSPHGGPHTCFPNTYIASSMFLVQSLQVALLLVNYRGSTGFGQESIESLPGHIGSNDTADILTAMEHAFTLTWKDLEGRHLHNNEQAATVSPLIINKEKLGIIGGSHGGFLSSHMCGQYPSLFKVCCLRNPVTNIPSMAGVSDIPDWCHVESHTSTVGGTFGGSSLYHGGITDEELIAMRKVSPVAFIHQYQTPTLICLGAKDRRVPQSQGIEFYHLLQLRSVPSKLMIFPEDVHAIDNPAAEAEHWIAIAHWISQYLG